ncbi:MAG: hypothetical protein HY951_06380 [Bacteroidia bacterium]|nr:hypothetical protein [Bacteroidia bacterium]
MNNSSFSLLSRNQDIKIDTNLITANFDGLKSFLNIVISFVYNRPSKEIVFDVVSISAKLKFQNPDMFLSETVLFAGYSIKEDETKESDSFNFILDDKAISVIEKY